MNYPTFEELLEVLNGYSNGVHTRAFIDGVESERERIIKLLENRRVICVGDIDCFELLETGSCDCKDLIALIKGETDE